MSGCFISMSRKHKMTRTNIIIKWRVHETHSIIPEATYSSYVRKEIKSKKSALSPTKMKQM